MNDLDLPLKLSVEDQKSEIFLDNAISFVQSPIKVVQEKIKNVPEKQRIKLDVDTIYRFSNTIENGYLKLELREIGAFAPYIYQSILTLNGIKKKYPMFRSCNTLEAVKQHIDKLFGDKKVKLRKDNEDSIIFVITVYNISETKDIEIEASRIMASEKDDVLIQLYKIQKDGIKFIKEIENCVKQYGPNGNNILEKLNEIQNKYQ